MNNPKSTVLGWGSLIAAAGVSYYFAKKGINERRQQQDAAGTRPTEKLDWRAKIERDEKQAASSAQVKEATRPENTVTTTKTSSSTDETPPDLNHKPSRFQSSS